MWRRVTRAHDTCSFTEWGKGVVLKKVSCIFSSLCLVVFERKYRSVVNSEEELAV